MNKDRVNVKLKAIKDKDTAEILKKHTWLPNIGYPKTEQEITAWLKKRIDTLEATLRCKSDEEAAQLLHNKKAAFNKSPNTVKASELSASDFDKLCEIRLIQFALGASTKWY